MLHGCCPRVRAFADFVASEIVRSRAGVRITVFRECSDRDILSARWMPDKRGQHHHRQVFRSNHVDWWQAAEFEQGLSPGTFQGEDKTHV
jgi:hypothetical protein